MRIISFYSLREAKRSRRLIRPLAVRVSPSAPLGAGAPLSADRVRLVRLVRLVGFIGGGVVHSTALTTNARLLKYLLYSDLVEDVRLRLWIWHSDEREIADIGGLDRRRHDFGHGSSLFMSHSALPNENSRACLSHRTAHTARMWLTVRPTHRPKLSALYGQQLDSLRRR